MDITEVNDFLLQQATGRTREQVQADINGIKALRAEVVACEKRNAELTASNEVENALNIKLRGENERLKTILDSNTAHYNDLNPRYVHIVSNLPILEAKIAAKKKELANLSATVTTLTAEREALEADILKRILAIDVKHKELEERERQNIYETIKVEELLNTNANIADENAINGVAVHIHVRKIQEKLDKKGIKFDVLRELQ